MQKPVLKTYLKLCTEFYDLEQHVNGAQAQAFFLHHAHQAHGPILEPMCGTGRFLIPMLQAGFDVEGFDASAHMLDAFKKKYALISNQTPPVRQEWVQHFSSNKRYQLIFVPYGSWGLITNLEESQKGLSVLFQHLLPGGKLILEIETVASVPQPCGIWRRGIHTRVDGSKIALSTLTSYDNTSQIFQSLCRYESMVNGHIEETEEEDFRQYLYRFDELDELLKRAGFKDIKKYPAYDCTQAPDENTSIIIYECSKE